MLQTNLIFAPRVVKNSMCTFATSGSSARKASERDLLRTASLEENQIPTTSMFRGKTVAKYTAVIKTSES